MKRQSCKTCEHDGDKGQEYCGSCDDGLLMDNWQEAGWIKDEKIEVYKKCLERIGKIIEETIITTLKQNDEYPS